MASEAQVLANRRNAEKSTGPRTAEGKAASSQNAVTHGLLARRCLISTEDPEEFDSHRESMMAQLNPAGPLETALAERIVSLSWRLKRVERMQDEALDCLLTQDGAGLEGENDELGSFEQTGESALGRVVVKDFAGDRALERLMIYERRIENSLYRTIGELDRVKMLGSFNTEEKRRYGELACRDPHLAGGPSPSVTPRGVTTNGPAFQTKPIALGPERWRPPDGSVLAALSRPRDSACRVASTS
jgi:hypothetical protein